MNPPYEIFLSYAGLDEERVSPVYEALHRAGCRVFFAPRTILPGEAVLPTCEQEARRCRVFVAFLSRNMQQTGEPGDAGRYQNREIRIASEEWREHRRPKLVSVLLDPDAASRSDHHGLTDFKPAGGPGDAPDVVATNLLGMLLRLLQVARPQEQLRDEEDHLMAKIRKVLQGGLSFAPLIRELLGGLGLPVPEGRCTWDAVLKDLAPDEVDRILARLQENADEAIPDLQEDADETIPALREQLRLRIAARQRQRAMSQLLIDQLGQVRKLVSSDDQDAPQAIDRLSDSLEMLDPPETATRGALAVERARLALRQDDVRRAREILLGIQPPWLDHVAQERTVRMLRSLGLAEQARLRAEGHPELLRQLDALDGTSPDVVSADRRQPWWVRLQAIVEDINHRRTRRPALSALAALEDPACDDDVRGDLGCALVTLLFNDLMASTPGDDHLEPALRGRLLEVVRPLLDGLITRKAHTASGLRVRQARAMLAELEAEPDLSGDRRALVEGWLQSGPDAPGQEAPAPVEVMVDGQRVVFLRRPPGDGKDELASADPDGHRLVFQALEALHDRTPDRVPTLSALARAALDVGDLPALSAGVRAARRAWQLMPGRGQRLLLAQALALRAGLSAEGADAAAAKEVWELHQHAGDAPEQLRVWAPLALWAAQSLRLPEALPLAERARVEAGPRATRQHDLLVALARELVGRSIAAADEAWGILQREGRARPDDPQLDAWACLQVARLLMAHGQDDPAWRPRLQQWCAWSESWFPTHQSHVALRVRVRRELGELTEADLLTGLNVGVLWWATDEQVAQAAGQEKAGKILALHLYDLGVASLRWLGQHLEATLAQVYLDLKDRRALLAPSPRLRQGNPHIEKAAMGRLELLVLEDLGLLGPLLESGCQLLVPRDELDRLTEERGALGLPEVHRRISEGEELGVLLEGLRTSPVAPSAGWPGDRAWAASVHARFVEVEPEDGDLSAAEVLSLVRGNGPFESSTAAPPERLVFSTAALRWLAARSACGELQQWASRSGVSLDAGLQARTWAEDDRRAAGQLRAARELMARVDRRVGQALDERRLVAIDPPDARFLPDGAQGSQADAAREALRPRGLLEEHKDAVLVSADGATSDLLLHSLHPGLAHTFRFERDGWTGFRARLKTLDQRVCSIVELAETCLVLRDRPTVRLDLVGLGFIEALDGEALDPLVEEASLREGGPLDQILGDLCQRFAVVPHGMATSAHVYLAQQLVGLVTRQWMAGLDEQPEVEPGQGPPPAARLLASRVLHLWEERVGHLPAVRDLLPAFFALRLLDPKLLPSWFLRRGSTVLSGTGSRGETLWRLLRSGHPAAERWRVVTDAQLADPHITATMHDEARAQLLGHAAGWYDRDQAARSVGGQPAFAINDIAGSACAIRAAAWAIRPTMAFGLDTNGVSWTAEQLLQLLADHLGQWPMGDFGVEWLVQSGDPLPGAHLLVPGDAILLRAAPAKSAEWMPHLAAGWARYDDRVRQAILRQLADPSSEARAAWVEAAAASPWRAVRAWPPVLGTWVGHPVWPLAPRSLDELRALLGDPWPAAGAERTPGWTVAPLRHAAWLPGVGALRNLREELSRPADSLRIWREVLAESTEYPLGALVHAIFGLRCLAERVAVIEVDGQPIDLRMTLPQWFLACMNALLPPERGASATGHPARLSAPQQDDHALVLGVARMAHAFVLRLAGGDLPADETLELTWQLVGWWFDVTRDTTRDRTAILAAVPNMPVFRREPHRLDPWLVEGDPSELFLAAALAAFRAGPLPEIEPGAAAPEVVDHADLSGLASVWIGLLGRAWTARDRALSGTTPSPQTWLGPTTIQDLALANLIHHAPEAWGAVPVTTRLVLIERLGSDEPRLYPAVRDDLVRLLCAQIQRLETVEHEALERVLERIHEVSAARLIELRLSLLIVGRGLPDEALGEQIASLDEASDRARLGGAWFILRRSQGDHALDADAIRFVHCLQAHGHSPRDGVLAVLRALVAGAVAHGEAAPLIRRWTSDLDLRHDPELSEALDALGLGDGA